MPVFVDPKTGERYDSVPEEDAERARKEFGFVTPEEYDKSQAVEQAGEGTGLQSVGEAFQRGVGARADLIQKATGFGTAPGLDEDDQGNKLPGGGLTALQDAYSPEARLREEAHPLLAGVGTGASVAGESALGGLALGAAVPGFAALGTTAGAVVGDAIPQAIQQEYDNAWLEQRPMDLKNVAANTLMFAGGDFLFRGALSGLGAIAGKSKGLLGGRNVVSEAQGAARELVNPQGAHSVGAASAADLAEPYDDAINQMSDKSAAVLARDADDHIHLVSQDASEAFTRLNDGISESLGTNLKHEDIAKYAADLDDKTLQRQAKWLDSMAEQGDAAARQIAQFTEGNKGALDFGNLGKSAVKYIDDFNHRISGEADAGARNILTDEYKKRLDKLTLAIDADRTMDSEAHRFLKEYLAPVREGLRKGLENAKYFGGAADLQKALNPGWHQFLEHWPKVQQTVLDATGHVKFDVGGAGRITKESTIDKMLSLFGKDPRANQDFGRHLKGAFEGLQTLIDAREAHGIVRKEGLEVMQGDLRNLMEDWNLASTVGVAKNRVAAMKKDSRKWGKFALDFAESAPVIGNPIRVARSLGEVMSDLHLPANEPVGKVWDAAYKRYAGNPAFQDPSVIRNYPDWIAEAMRQRGGQVPPVPPAGGVANDLGGPGIARARVPDEAASATPAIDRARRRAQEGGYVVVGNQSAIDPRLPEHLKGWRPSVKGYQFSDLNGLPADVAQAERLRRVRDTAAWRKREGGWIELPNASGAAPQPKVDKLAPGERDYVNMSARRMREDLNMGLAESDIRATVDHSIAELEPGMARAELGRVADVIASNRKAIMQLPVSHRTEILHSAPDGYEALNMAQKQKIDTLPPKQKDAVFSYVTAGYENLKSAEKGGGGSVAKAQMPHLYEAMKSLEVEEPTKMGPLYRGFNVDDDTVRELLTKDKLVAHSMLSTSYSPRTAFGFSTGDANPVILKIDKLHVGAVPYSLVESEVLAPRGAVFKVIKRTATEDGTPIIHLVQTGVANPKAVAGAVALATVLGIDAASSTANAAEPERPPPPAQTPDALYRDALKEINQAGQQEMKAFASDALRKKTRGKDKGPLALFAGKQSIQDAVEATRDRLEEIAGDPTSLIKQLTNNSGDLSKTHPSVYSALVEKAAQVAGYLQQSLPPKSAVTLLNPQGGALSFDRSWDYAARFVGATQPRAALREVARGNAPPEMIEAVAQNWPEVWDGFRVELLGQVQRMNEAGRHIPSEKLRRLDSMLGMNGQLDPSASLDVAQHFLAAQDAELQKRQQTGQQKGPMPSSAGGGAAFRTKLEQINAGE